MNLFPFLTSAVSELEEEPSGGTSPIFWGIVGVFAVGLVIMVIQNFVIKREEHYK